MRKCFYGLSPFSVLLEYLANALSEITVIHVNAYVHSYVFLQYCCSCSSPVNCALGAAINWHRNFESRPSAIARHSPFAICDVCWLDICYSNCIFYCCHKLSVVLKASIYSNSNCYRHSGSAISNNGSGQRQLNIRRKSNSHQMRDCRMSHCPGLSLVATTRLPVSLPLDSCQCGLVLGTSAATA